MRTIVINHVSLNDTYIDVPWSIQQDGDRVATGFTRVIAQTWPERVHVETYLNDEGLVIDTLDPNDDQDSFAVLAAELTELQHAVEHGPLTIPVFTDELEQIAVLAQAYVVSGRRAWK